MSRLTVTEKEHWKQRIEARINRAIDKVKATAPKEFETCRTSLKLEAHRKLGIQDQYLRMLEIDQSITTLKAERDQHELNMHQHVVDNPNLTNRWDREQSFRHRLLEAEKNAEAELYQKFNEGRQILKLQEEKESLLDTIWLATSSTQIRNLWTELAGILGDESTILQQQILSKAESLS